MLISGRFFSDRCGMVLKNLLSTENTAVYTTRQPPTPPRRAATYLQQPEALLIKLLAGVVFIRLQSLQTPLTNRCRGPKLMLINTAHFTSTTTKSLPS